MYHNLQTTSDIQRFFQSLKLVTLLYIKKKKKPSYKKNKEQSMTTSNFLLSY